MLFLRGVITWRVQLQHMGALTKTEWRANNLLAPLTDITDLHINFYYYHHSTTGLQK